LKQQQWFRLALQHNFVQGRQTDHVVAACLYIACRKAKTSRTICYIVVLYHTQIIELVLIFSHYGISIGLDWHQYFEILIVIMIYYYYMAASVIYTFI